MEQRIFTHFLSFLPGAFSFYAPQENKPFFYNSPLTFGRGEAYLLSPAAAPVKMPLFISGIHKFNFALNKHIK